MFVSIEFRSVDIGFLLFLFFSFFGFAIVVIGDGYFWLLWLETKSKLGVRGAILLLVACGNSSFQLCGNH